MTAKMRVRVGEVEVEYEGPESYLDEKLVELIDRLKSIYESMSPPGGQPGTTIGEAPTKTKDPGTLAAFLKVKNATSPQVKTFLATALWLQLKGKDKLQTRDINKALKDNRQSRLGNASDCLNQNVSKGFCVKDGKEFYVAPEGISELE